MIVVERTVSRGHWPARLWCGRRQHDWLMEGQPPAEFVAVPDVCLRCSAKREILPIGVCLCGHSFVDHAPRCACGCSGWM